MNPMHLKKKVSNMLFRNFTKLFLKTINMLGNNTKFPNQSTNGTNDIIETL